ncbi:MAG: nitroreductase family protein [Deltaproteobacteria bacterium]|nr:nitroreductase family protein [Deltaproteobacteria bacterium]
MNQKLDFIFRRRSIRKYEDKKIPAELLTDLLEAAMAAPSAVARDPWHFIVLQSRENLDRLADILPHGKMLRQATAAFVVCGDINRTHDRQESYMLQDLSAAVENVLLAAAASGLGACWLGVHPRQERMAGIIKMFQLPDNIVPMCAIALGWPAEKPEARTRYRSECVHRERW